MDDDEKSEGELMKPTNSMDLRLKIFSDGIIAEAAPMLRRLGDFRERRQITRQYRIIVSEVDCMQTIFFCLFIQMSMKNLNLDHKFTAMTIKFQFLNLRKRG